MKIIDNTTGLTSGQQQGVDKGLSDIEHLNLELTVTLQNHVSGSRCGYGKRGKCTIGVKDCASRGYSDYRWRVNRTPHGVIIHEIGHHLDRTLNVPTDLFAPRTDITNYSDGSWRENFAESWRVWVSSPELLRAINEEKWEWFNERFDNPRHEMLEEHIQEYTKIIRKQLREASTNEHIRQYLYDRGIDF